MLQHPWLQEDADSGHWLSEVHGGAYLSNVDKLAAVQLSCQPSP
jgi:hypothetical protein